MRNQIQEIIMQIKVIKMLLIIFPSNQNVTVVLQRLSRCHDEVAHRLYQLYWHVAMTLSSEYF
jgi:hypothetical protein